MKPLCFDIFLEIQPELNGAIQKIREQQIPQNFYMNHYLMIVTLTSNFLSNKQTYTLKRTNSAYFQLHITHTWTLPEQICMIHSPD